jgi:hypothetical protein
MRLCFLLVLVVLYPLSAWHTSSTQDLKHRAASALDSDDDGINDQLEQMLLEQFVPRFEIGRKDCSNVPAEFRSDHALPELDAENGTIYGQVFPAKASTQENSVAEIHYFHLWRRDCGEHGHPLDTEHVSVLVKASSGGHVNDTWIAVYWYAAAHENTVCDVSQIARASTLHAEDHGARVWISPDKHASYLNETLCQKGCGADICREMTSLPRGKLINLGEPGHPMNGSLFISSNRWPIAIKMAETNFPAQPVARLNQLPDTDIAWFNAGRHPAQGIIAISSSTEGAIAEGGHSTTTAVSVAGDSTGNSLQKSYRNTAHALGTTARHLGSALHVTSKPSQPQR